MDKNSTQYLKYAIGEIILVVVGILLALQINNWNEDQKRRKLKSNYINLLLDDLQQDSVMVADQLQFFKADTTALNQQLQRIKDFPTRDTIVHIARNEFSSNVQIITAFNNKTYNTLINTGDIDLFDSWLVEDLSRLDQIQKLTVSVYDLSMNSFAASLRGYREKLTVYDDALAGELLDPIWNELTLTEILTQVNLISTAKLTTDRNVLQILPVYLDIVSNMRYSIQNEYEPLN